MRAIEQERNLSQVTIARFMQLYVNSHQDSEKEAYNEAIFMPHANTWLRSTSAQTINCSRLTAIEFLTSYESFDPDVSLAFNSILTELYYLAQD